MRFPERPDGAVGWRTRLRRGAAALPFAFVNLLAMSGQGAAQENAPQIWTTGWAGAFADIGGFSDARSNAFYQFDGAFAFGGGVHRIAGQGPALGIDVLYSRPTWERFHRSTGARQGTGDARVASAMASTRLQGGGLLGVYLTAGAGIFAWDVDDPDLGNGWDLDPALQIGVGLEYMVRARLRVFAEYSQWWVYHQKDETVVRNTAKNDLIRVGGRVGF